MITAKPAAQAARAGIDAVLFDMDGVLLEITDSIRAATCLAVPFYMREILHWPAPDDLITSADIELFKHAGGFNDDVELTRALVLHYLVKEHEHPGATPETLNVFRPNLADFARRISERGGGLKVAEELRLESLTREDRDQILLQYRTRRIAQVFEEIFGGEYTEELYGHTPEFYHGPGYVNKDKQLIEPERLTAGKSYGILTGRTPAEARLGLRMAGLAGIIPETSVITPKDAARKPNPAGLRKLMERLGAASAVYVGDTLDDYRTVARYKQEYADRPILAALVMTGPMGDRNRKIFERSGADVVASDVNELLAWLAE
jgi:HAD superfamily hydrolase (TIGR01548 family)